MSTNITITVTPDRDTHDTYPDGVEFEINNDNTITLDLGERQLTFIGGDLAKVVRIWEQNKEDLE